MFREFPAVQWLELHAFTVEGPVLIPGQGPKTMQGVWHSQKRKKKCVYHVPPKGSSGTLVAFGGPFGKGRVTLWSCSAQRHSLFCVSVILKIRIHIVTHAKHTSDRTVFPQLSLLST